MHDVQGILKQMKLVPVCATCTHLKRHTLEATHTCPVQGMIIINIWFQHCNQHERK